MHSNPIETHSPHGRDRLHCIYLSKQCPTRLAHVERRVSYPGLAQPALIAGSGGAFCWRLRAGAAGVAGRRAHFQQSQHRYTWSDASDAGHWGQCQHLLSNSDSDAVRRNPNQVTSPRCSLAYCGLDLAALSGVDHESRKPVRTEYVIKKLGWFSKRSICLKSSMHRHTRTYIHQLPMKHH